MEKERPIECSGCNKPLTIVYQEIVLQSKSCVHMCDECPLLEKKLHGGTNTEGAHPTLPQGLCCNSCHTSVEDVRAGEAMGCSQCYAIFADAILAQLSEAELIAPHMGNSLHIGRTPHDTGDILASKKITELNEELNKALMSENYEEAAWLRDQIKALMEKADE